MEKLLMLGTSYCSREMLRYAKSQGVYTIVTDYLDPEHSLAKKESDEYWMINTCELDKLETKCREEGVTAVICGISEFNLEMCMELCKRLGFPCYCTPEAWHYSRDKADFKKLCKKVGAPIPTDYYLTDALTDEELDAVKLPVMVKPVDMSANRGISYCNTREQLVDAYHLARSMSKSSKIIVERMLHGEEWYSSYVISDGEIRLVALNAMYCQPGEPKNCYTITTTVSDNVTRFINEINPQIEEVLKEVGCKEGYVWVQVMLDEDGHFYIIEMGYRLDGDMIFIPYEDVCGFSTVKMLVDYARGIKTPVSALPEPQTKAYKKCGTSMMLWTNNDGVLTEVVGFDKLSKMKGIKVETLCKLGDHIDKYTFVATIMFTTDTVEEMCDMIQYVNDHVKFINERGEDVVIKYTDFDYLKSVYYKGLSEG